MSLLLLMCGIIYTSVDNSFVVIENTDKEQQNKGLSENIQQKYGGETKHKNAIDT